MQHERRHSELMGEELPAAAATTPKRSGRALIELLLILAVVQALLVLSDSIGGATLLGGAIGWLGIMLGVVLVWWSLRSRGLGWPDIGFRRPRRPLLAVVLGVLLAVVTLVVVGVLLQVVVVPLLKEPPDSSRFAALRGNPIALALGLFSVWTSAAFGEEILARGYLLNRLAGLFGGTRGAWIFSVILGASIFGSMHFYQGPSGMVATGLVGLVFGFVFLLNGKNLWMLVLAHGIIDTLSFVQIYLS
jgi:membrane protease YdiL (CAAX protease family)